MKKGPLYLIILICPFALSLYLGGQEHQGQRGHGAPIKASGPAPNAAAVLQDKGPSQYPTNTSLGYRGVVTANVNKQNDTTNIDEIVCDFGALGIWVMEGISVNYAGNWNMISGANSDTIMSARFASDGNEAILGDFGSLGLWKWTYAGYPGNWVQLTGVNGGSAFATDDDGDGLDEIQVDCGGIGVWRFDDNNGGAGTWNQYSGLDPVHGLRMATFYFAQGAQSFSSAGVWRLWWSGGPQSAQLTGLPIAGNDNVSVNFLRAAADTLIL